jgi:hypothetical protein
LSERNKDLNQTGFLRGVFWLWSTRFSRKRRDFDNGSLDTFLAFGGVTVSLDLVRRGGDTPALADCLSQFTGAGNKVSPANRSLPSQRA